MALSSSSPLRSTSSKTMVRSDSLASSSTSSHGGGGGNNAPPAARATTRTRTRTVLVGFFIMTNLLSALTWSVFHIYFKSGDLSTTLLSYNNNLLSDAPTLEKERTSISSSVVNNNNRTLKTTAASSASSSVQQAVATTARLPSATPSSSRQRQQETISYPLLKPHNASMRPVLYQRMEDHYKNQRFGLEPHINRDTCLQRDIAKENQNNNNNNNVNTIEYMACCGLGHRLGRMSNAAFLASKLKAHFYGFWRCCNDVEVFSYLFGSEPIILFDDEKEKKDSSINHHDETSTSNKNTTTLITAAATKEEPYHIQFRNEVVGFRGGPKRCGCSQEKLTSDFAFFSTLRERYTKRHIVDDFVQEHFTNQTLSIAIHIRAGNGETGDFVNKNRHISDPEAFVRNTVNHIREIAQNLTADASTRHLAPLVFIATDTQSYVDAFRTALSTETAVSSSTTTTMSNNNETWTGSSIPPIPVVQLPVTTRAAEGEGVMFGLFNKVTTSGEKCLDGWDNVIQDMLVLSHADVVFAPKFSSFTQTIPVVLGLGKKERRIRTPFCDVRHHELSCYEDFHQWCCGKPWPGRSNTYHDVHEAWHDILLSEQ